MVECQDQCTILDTESITPATEDDEGYDSDAQSSELHRISSLMSRARLQIRRPSDMKGACVSKTVRLRKRKDHKKVKTSADSEA